MDKIKKHAETLVETLVLLAFVASAVVLVMFIVGQVELLEKAKVFVEWLAVADVAYVAYRVYRLILNQKESK